MAEHVEVVIKIPKYYLTHPQDYSCLAECVRRGTPLDSIIADIEAARDKDKLCEYPYNRCIDILKKEFHTYNSNEHLHTYKFTYIHGLDNSYRKVEFQAKNEKEAKETFYKKVGENFEHRILYITQDDNMIYEFC